MEEKEIIIKCLEILVITIYIYIYIQILLLLSANMCILETRPIENNG